MSRRILFLSQWFDPEYSARGLKFVEGLIARGHEVEVATGFPNYPTGKIAPGYRLRPYQLEIMRGVRVNRLYLYPSHDRSSLGRALNYLSFCFSATLFCLLRGRRFDAIYVYHPPITVGLAAALGGYVTRRPFLLEVQDLWPDSVAASGMSGVGTLARLLDPICRFVYARAARVIGQSRGMTERLIDRGVPREKATTLFNWADEEFARPGGGYDLAALAFENRFNIVYGGNLGRVQGLETLVRAAQAAGRVEPKIQLTLIGEGVDRDRIAALIADLGVDNVRLRPGAPQSQIGDVFAAADVLVAHLVDDPLFEITIPSKLQFYMAMGKPILIGVRGEAATIVTGSKAGVAAPPEDVEAMTEAMIHLARLPRSALDQMGENARNAYLETYSFDAGVGKAIASIEAALAA